MSAQHTPTPSDVEILRAERAYDIAQDDQLEASPMRCAIAATAYSEMLIALRNIDVLVRPGGFHKTRLDERTINLIECQLNRALAKVSA